MIILNAAEVRQALPMDQAIAAMKSAFAALSAGHAEVPLRLSLPVTAHGASSMVMPAYVQGKDIEALAVKVVTIYPHNPARGLPLIHAAVLVLEANSGRPAALLDGGALTAIRTGAASGAATDLLARADSHTAAIFGAGVQGRTQLEAICTVRDIQTAWIYDPDPQRSRQLIAEMAGRGRIPADLRLATSAEQAVQTADIICTATTSSTPVFEDRLLRPGVHINGVGSYTPEMQEIPTETVQRAKVVIDSHTASMTEAGDLLIPISQGAIRVESIHAELGAVVLGQVPGRTDPEEITLFKSVGVAVQDATAAQLALTNAARAGLGREVPW